MSKGKALEMFPMLKSEGLVGALVYYDGVLSPPCNTNWPEIIDHSQASATTRA
jgi:glycerol-3-phosphate dehydrogenase